MTSQGNLTKLFPHDCWERGQKMPALALLKLFEKEGEAYQRWNSRLPGYASPDSRIATPFESEGTIERFV